MIRAVRVNVDGSTTTLGGTLLCFIPREIVETESMRRWVRVTGMRAENGGEDVVHVFIEQPWPEDWNKFGSTVRSD